MLRTLTFFFFTEFIINILTILSGTAISFDLKIIILFIFIPLITVVYFYKNHFRLNLFSKHNYVLFALIAILGLFLGDLLSFGFLYLRNQEFYSNLSLLRKDFIMSILFFVKSALVFMLSYIGIIIFLKYRANKQINRTP